MNRIITAAKGERRGNRSECQFRAKVTVNPEPNGSAKDNKFPKHIITRMEKQIQTKAQTNPKQCDKTKYTNNIKCAIFSYHSPKIRKITNLFRQTNVHIAYKTQTQYIQKNKA
jgi:hypothetical protein